MVLPQGDVTILLRESTEDKHKVAEQLMPLVNYERRMTGTDADFAARLGTR